MFSHIIHCQLKNFIYLCIQIMNMEERLGIFDDIDMDLENISKDEFNEYLEEIIKYCKSLKEE